MFKEFSLPPCEHQVGFEAHSPKELTWGRIWAVSWAAQTQIYYSRPEVTKTPCLSRGVFGNGMSIPAGLLTVS